MKPVVAKSIQKSQQYLIFLLDDQEYGLRLLRSGALVRASANDRMGSGGF
jgi:hypothetical protein